jgi:flagellar biosynthesis/type III secretory pathway chaperone
MFTRIQANMDRQAKALELLEELLEEEFSHLTGRNPQAISGIEMSIQKLIRHVAMERVELKRLASSVKPGTQNMRDFLANMDDRAGTPYRERLERIEAVEKRCAFKSERNSEMALGMLDQSKSMIQYIQDRVNETVNKAKPRTYGANARMGAYAGGASAGSILRGRL